MQNAMHTKSQTFEQTISPGHALYRGKNGGQFREYRVTRIYGHRLQLEFLNGTSSFWVDADRCVVAADVAAQLALAPQPVAAPVEPSEPVTIEAPALQYHVTPWSHQARAIAESVNRKGYGLFFDMGTGKTATAINIYRMACAVEKRQLSALIISPLSVTSNWRREFATHAPEYAESVQVLGGTLVKRAKQLSDTSKRVVVCNYELCDSKTWEVIAARRWDVLILDESHRIKSVKAKRTQKILALAEKVERRYILTGTPVTNSLQDLWSQFRVIAPHVFDRNFYSWRLKYFIDRNANKKGRSNYFPDFVPANGAKEKLHSIISQHAMSAKKSEVLDLPPLVRQTLNVSLTPELATHYASMAEMFLTVVEGEAVTADIVLTQMLRLMQICSGILQSEEGNTKYVGSAKLAALRELLEDIAPHHKVIIWTCFVPTYGDIGNVCDELGLPFCSITGGQSQTERQQSIDDFNNDPKVRVMIANPAAGGVGVNLQAASYMIYYSKNYNLEHDMQSEARAYRAGSEIHEKITRIDLVTEGTIEEQVTDALAGKLELATFISNLKGANRD